MLMLLSVCICSEYVQYTDIETYCKSSISDLENDFNTIKMEPGGKMCFKIKEILIHSGDIASIRIYVPIIDENDSSETLYEVYYQDSSYIAFLRNMTQICDLRSRNTSSEPDEAIVALEADEYETSVTFYSLSETLCRDDNLDVLYLVNQKNALIQTPLDGNVTTSSLRTIIFQLDGSRVTIYGKFRSYTFIYYNESELKKLSAYTRYRYTGLSPVTLYDIALGEGESVVTISKIKSKYFGAYGVFLFNLSSENSVKISDLENGPTYSELNLLSILFYSTTALIVILTIASVISFIYNWFKRNRIDTEDSISFVHDGREIIANDNKEMVVKEYIHGYETQKIVTENPYDDVVKKQ